MNIKESIWVEKYRPKKIDDMILPERVISKVKNGVSNHMLFHGGPGLGKTSLAKIIAKNRNYIYINCSVDTGVDTVRTKITDFCSNIAFSFNKSEDREKIVILDEFDGVSESYMKAMRGTIEQFANTTKFIATCNFINKIPDYMQSRFDCIDFNFPKEDELYLKKKYIKRIYEITKKEGLSIDPNVIVKIVKKYFPDLRSTITFLQGIKSEGKDSVTDSDLVKFKGEYKDLYKLFFEKTTYFEIYSYIYKNYLNNEDAVFIGLGKEFIEYISKEQEKRIDIIGPIISLQAEWYYKSQFVADKLTSLSALVYNIHKIINK